MAQHPLPMSCSEFLVMSEYRKQSAFLKELMSLCEDNPAHSALTSRLSSAESSARCSLCACRLVGMIALLAMAGVGYSAVLLPEFFDNTTHVVIRFFTALTLGSTVCFAVFFGLWSWYRNTVNHIHDDCRRIVLSMVVPQQSDSSSTSFHPVLLNGAELKVIPISADNSSYAGERQSFAKAS